MKKRLALGKKFSLSNRVLYSLITLGILMVIAVGVSGAWANSNGVGHSYDEIQPCSDGQILKMNGGNWVCENDNYEANTDTQDLSLSGTTLSLTDGGSVDLSDVGGSSASISCTTALVNCQDVNVGYSVGENKWTYCPAGKVIYGLRTYYALGGTTQNSYVNRLRCCSISVSCS